MKAVWRYLRAMAVLAWVSFRYPLTTTIINLETGEYWNLPEESEPRQEANENQLEQPTR